MIITGYFVTCQGRHAGVASFRYLVLDALDVSILPGPGSSWRLKDVLHTRFVSDAVVKPLVQQLRAACTERSLCQTVEKTTGWTSSDDGYWYETSRIHPNFKTASREDTMTFAR